MEAVVRRLGHLDTRSMPEASQQPPAPSSTSVLAASTCTLREAGTWVGPRFRLYGLLGLRDRAYISTLGMTTTDRTAAFGSNCQIIRPVCELMQLSE